MTKAAEKWRALIGEQESSGQTVREFAASRGLAAGTVFWWRSRLRRRPREDRAALVPVEVVDEVVEQRPSIELVVRDALVLRLPRGFDETDLRRVLAALGTPC